LFLLLLLRLPVPMYVHGLKGKNAESRIMSARYELYCRCSHQETDLFTPALPVLNVSRRLNMRLVACKDGSKHLLECLIECNSASQQLVETR